MLFVFVFLFVFGLVGVYVKVSRNHANSLRRDRRDDVWGD